MQIPQNLAPFMRDDLNPEYLAETNGILQYLNPQYLAGDTANSMTASHHFMILANAG